jgi:TIR domain
MSTPGPKRDFFAWFNGGKQSKRVLYVSKKGEMRQPDLYRVGKKAIRERLSRPHDPVDFMCFLDDQAFNRVSVLEAYLRADAVDLIVFDSTELDSDLMGVLTLALVRQIPVLALVHERIMRVLNLKGLRTLSFHPSSLGVEYQKIFANTVSEAFSAPETFVPQNIYRDSIRHRVFIAYSHKNSDVLDRVLVHLKPVERLGFIDAWSDKKIAVGSAWRHEIETALSRARAAILLVSADFLASEFIARHELPRLLQEHQTKSLRLLPLIVLPCRFTRDPALSRFQALNDPAEPLLLLPYPQQEQVLDRLAEAVEESLHDMMERKSAETTG